MTAETCAPKSESAKKNEDWMNTKWRPAMGWMYMLVCITDFVIFPILWSMIQVIGDGKVESQWQPITLQGAGLFHIAMGAILGIAAYGRTQEKMAGANNGGLQMPSRNSSSGWGTSGPDSYAPARYQTTPMYGNAPMGGNTMSTAPSFGRGPIQPEHPEI
jgi:Holin of 3TMs, for gene-transfer release